ncbi:hypothetical protein [Clostridium sp. AWRP]|nr:hypothetical protein [Clostridium sp. AWRP]
MSGGHIVQSGRHEDLIREDGVYSEFINVRKKAIGWSIGQKVYLSR